MTTYNTGNPVGSTDARDLYDNSQALDQLINGSGTYSNRLGVQRRTLAKLETDFDAQLADAESDLNVYRAESAASAAEALGYLQTIRATSYGAYDSDPATDPLGNPPTVGDEYFNTPAKLLKRWNGTTWQASDINTANLAASSGSSLVGYDGGFGAVATTVESKLREIVSVKDSCAVGDGIADDESDVESVLNCVDRAYAPKGTYKANLSFNIGASGTFLDGSGASSVFKSATVDYPVIAVGVDTTGAPIRNIRVENITVAYQPTGAGGGGGENNEAAIKVMQGYNVRILHTDFIENYLGLRFGRENQSLLPSKDCLGIGNYFLNSKSLPQEFIGVDACKHIAFAVRTETGKGTSQHGVRFAGQSTNCIAAAGSVIVDDVGSISTGASIQSGSGHVVSGMVVSGAEQGLQAIGSATAFAVGQFVSKKSKYFGARIQQVSGAIIDGLVLKDSQGVALHVVAESGSTPSHLHIHGYSDGSVAGPGADHIRIEGAHHLLDLTARGMTGGLNGINLTNTSSFCRGRLWSESITAGDGSARDMRIDGANHTLYIVCSSGTFSGSGHILDIQQATGSIVIGASNSIIRVKAGGTVTISGSYNTIVVSGADVVVSGSNNTVSGTASGVITDTGVSNDLAGLNQNKRSAIFTRTTTGASAAILRCGGRDSYVIEDGKMYVFEGRVAARRTDGTEQFAMYTFKGAIKRSSGAASTAILYSTVNADFESNPDWGFVLSANTTQGGLQLAVTGAAATIDWKASVNLTEV